MSIRLYDEALANKIKSWLPSEAKATVLKPDDLSNLYEIDAWTTGDKPIKLPMITISRDTDVTMNLPTWSTQSREGYTLINNGEKWLKFRNITVALNYQIDIYTKKAIEADSLLSEFLYKIMLDNQIAIEVKNEEGLNIRHVSTLTLDSTIRDTSDISERLFPGQFTRWTINVAINDAHIFSLPYKNIWSMDSDFEVKED